MMKKKFSPKLREDTSRNEYLPEVCVVGLGNVGLPTALHATKYFSVVGYDTNLKAVDLCASQGVLVTENWLSIPLTDVYVITVSTGINEGNEPDLSAIYDVCGKIAEKEPEALVCIESTVPVGTSRRVAEKFGLKYVAHCPHRYWAGDPADHGVVQKRVLGALNEESMEKGEWFYSRLKIPYYAVSSLETAEMSKIAENAYRFVQIAFAEELKVICDKLGLLFDDVRAACNTKWNIKILEGRDGIHGDCLPKDIRYLAHLGKAPLLIGAIKADKAYKRALNRK
jgi:nucleotide sugar dehydrogenase